MTEKASMSRIHDKCHSIDPSAQVDAARARIIESRNHWIALAVEADARADYEERAGRGSGSGTAHRNKAEMYRRTAKALNLELETGKAHCACCLKPR